MINFHERMLPTRRGSNPQPTNHQSDARPTDPPRPIINGRTVQGVISCRIFQDVNNSRTFQDVNSGRAFIFKVSSKIENFMVFIGLDKSGYQVSIFLICPRKHMLWYSLEAPRRGASNEYHNICFCGQIRKISILLD